MKEEEVTLVDIVIKLKKSIGFLWSKKKLILIVGFAGGILGLSYSIFKPIKYKSHLTFIVESTSKSGGLGALSGLASSFGLGGIGGNGGLFENQINLMNYLQSNTILEDVLLSELDNSGRTFAQHFLECYQWNESLESTPSLSKIKFNVNEDRSNFSLPKDSVLHSICNFINENELISISKPDDEGSIIAINVLSESDSLSKFLPERLLEVVSEKYIEMKTRLSQQNVSLLQFQTDSVRRVLNASLISSASSADQVYGLNPAMAVKRVPVARDQIDVQASTILLGELIKNLELAKMTLKDQTPVIEVIDCSRFPLEEDKPRKLISIIVFGFLSVFITSVCLLSVRFYKKIIS
jgi:capsular polysaccharide biosynthesis protein